VAETRCNVPSVPAFRPVPSFANCAKGGYHRPRRSVPLCRFLTPTLANNARMGHPQWWWNAKTSQGGHSPVESEENARIVDFTELTTGLQTQTETHAKSLLSVWVFLCLSAALAWTVWLWPISNRFFYITFEGWRVNWPLSNAKLLIGNSLPGFLALAWARWEGREPFRDVLTSLFGWRTKLKWYVLAIALPVGVFLVSMCIVLVLFSENPRRPSALLLVNSLFSLPFGPLWEEIAWRAFALRRLQSRYSLLSSALIIGGYWGLWHIPMWVLTATYHTAPFLLTYCVNLIAWSIVFSFLYDRSGQSLPVTILLHSTILVAQNLVFFAVTRGTIYISPIATALSVCLAIIVAGKLRSTSSTVSVQTLNMISDDVGRDAGREL
jgi:membrane protease YdiL (CAAX protease family)